MVDAEKAFEDALLVFGGDTQTAVGDRDFDVGALGAGIQAAADGHRGTGWGVGHRVVEQVRQRGDQQRGIAVQDQQWPVRARRHNDVDQQVVS